MPNGKVGDHWYTDVTSHELDTFSPEVDALIRELDKQAAGNRPYTPWDDPARQNIERTVDGFLDEIGRDELAARSETVGLEFRSLSSSELTELLRRLQSLA